MTEREIDVWSAEWLGHTAHDFHSWSLKKGLPVFWDGMWVKWNPRHSLNDARLLLNECERQGLLGQITQYLYDKVSSCGPSNNPSIEFNKITVGLLATAEQITQAVWEVARELTEAAKE